MDENGNHGEQRIVATEADQIRDWAGKLGVTEVSLKTAIMQVGNRVSDIERHLAKRDDDEATAR